MNSFATSGAQKSTKVGVAAIDRSGNAPDVTLRVLLRPAPLRLRAFHTAVRRLGEGHVEGNAAQLGSALRSVVGMLAGGKRRGGGECLLDSCCRWTVVLECNAVIGSGDM